MQGSIFLGIFLGGVFVCGGGGGDAFAFLFSEKKKANHKSSEQEA